MRIVYSHPAYGAKNFTTTSHQILIGRQRPGLSIDLNPDFQVSQQHARLTLENGEWWLEDLGSTNGTQLNGKDVSKKTRITPADKITIGETQLAIIEDARAREEIAPAGTRSIIQASSARKRLSAFYEIGAAFAATEAADMVLKKIVEQLLHAIPSAEGAGLLLQEQDKLLLKAHLPQAQPSTSLSLAGEAITKKEGFIWRATEAVHAAPSIVRAERLSAMYAPLVVKHEALGVAYVDSTEQNAFGDDDLYLLTALSYQAAIVLKFRQVQKALQEEADIRAQMQRWFSPKIAKRVMAQANLWSGGERVQATILCSDIRGFTVLAANMTPARVTEALNDMFDALVPIVHKYDGTIDKFVGDSILAVFGTPEADPNQWEHALRAALDMQSAMRDLQEAWRMKGQDPFEIGIGIHTGEVLHGIIGAQQRREYTVIGDAVNRAARFCDGAERGEIVISSEVYEHVFSLIDAKSKTIATKHPTTEGKLQGYLVRGLKT